MFTNEKIDGTILATYPDQQTAMTDAKTRLEEDPELGEVYVFHTVEVGRAATVPDSDWQSTVAWLWAGEKILPPGPIPVTFTLHQEYVDTMGDAYDISDPKHENFHSIHADIWDARAGK